jgi:hypothetical protein
LDHRAVALNTNHDLLVGRFDSALPPSEEPMTATPAYETSPDKRHRRTSEEKEQQRRDIIETLRDGTREGASPVTLRRLFYLLLQKGFAKLETIYKRLSTMVCELRRDGLVPWEWIVDNTRRLQVPSTFTSIGQALKLISDIYRRDPWPDQDSLVYCLTEKDALGALLEEETQQYVVPLGVVRGFSSQTFLHEIAEGINTKAKGRPVFVYYFGDWDSSGLDVEAAAERILREFAPNVVIYWKRLAVTFEQIAAYNLITRPAKEGSSHSKRWLALSPEQRTPVEVDALSTEVCFDLLHQSTLSKIDQDRYRRTLKRERQERAQLRRWISKYSGE